ncbi:hypothetical protein BDR22DRAFT_867617 [Usnea florida]
MDRMTFKPPVQTYMSHKSFLCVEWNIGLKPPADFIGCVDQIVPPLLVNLSNMLEDASLV